jgi:peptide deformylase
VIYVIRTHPDRVLRRVAGVVDAMTDEIRLLCDDMVATMTAAHGLGLAANQIAVPLRIITVEAGSEKESDPLVLINPRIIRLEGEETGEEGCLSIPGFYEIVKRAKKAVVEGRGLDDRELTIECNGLLARAVQHEVDHLNGILFIDHLSPVKKQLFKREYKKEKK